MTHSHLLCDFWLAEGTCDLLKYVDPLQTILIEAAGAGGAHICHAHFHQFVPWGVTGFLLLEESHISLHTWVEERYAALDIFSCGTVDNDAILRYLTDRLQPRRVDLLEFRRGCPGSMYGATAICRPPSHRLCVRTR
jgi:S-adenosylmethionine decarboxylase